MPEILEEPLKIPVKPDQWKRLAREIVRGTCVLVLGPKAALDPRDITQSVLPVQLALELLGSLQENIVLPKADQPAQLDYSQLPSENLARVAQFYQRFSQENDLHYRVESFYEEVQNQTTVLHQELAKLPFKVCLCATHDRLMFNALQMVNEPEKKTPVECYYSLNVKQEIGLNELSVQRPLVYHLLGSPRAGGSLILTEDDLMELLIKLVKQDPPIDEKLLSHLRDRHTNFLFVGFGFRGNYARFLLKILAGQDSPKSGGQCFFFETEQAPNESQVAFLNQDSAATFYRTPLIPFAKHLVRCVKEQQGGTTPAVAAPLVPTVKPVLFLCHTSVDKEEIQWLPAALEARGITCWLDKNDLQAGVEWDRHIKSVIETEVNYVLILASPRMLVSGAKYFYKEINVALEWQQSLNPNWRPLIPAVIDCPPPWTVKGLLEKIHPQLTRWQAIGLQNQNPAGLDKLAADILSDWKERLKWVPA